MIACGVKPVQFISQKRCIFKNMRNLKTCAMKHYTRVSFLTRIIEIRKRKEIIVVKSFDVR
jgi:hypothetical protein